MSNPNGETTPLLKCENNDDFEIGKGKGKHNPEEFMSDISSTQMKLSASKLLYETYNLSSGNLSVMSDDFKQCIAVLNSLTTQQEELNSEFNRFKDGKETFVLDIKSIEEKIEEKEEEITEITKTISQHQLQYNKKIELISTEQSCQLFIELSSILETLDSFAAQIKDKEDENRLLKNQLKELKGKIASYSLRCKELNDFKSKNEREINTTLFKLSDIFGKGKCESSSEEEDDDAGPAEEEIKTVSSEQQQQLLQVSKGKGGGVSSEKMIELTSGSIYETVKRKEKRKLDADANKLSTKRNEIDSTNKDLVENDRKILTLLKEMKECRTNRIDWYIKLTEQENDLQLCEKQQKHNDYELTNAEFMTIQKAVELKGIKKGIIYRGFNTKDKILSLGRSVKRKGIAYGLFDPTICIDNYEGTLHFFKIVDNIWKYDSYLKLTGTNITKHMSERAACISLDKEFNYDLTEFEVPQIYVNKRRKSSFIEDW